MLVALLPVMVQAMTADPAPRFSPPLDTDWRYRIEETREQDGRTDRYRLDRIVRFARDGDGYTATLTVTAVDGGIASGPGAMFEAGMSGFVGVPVVFRLDASGAITDIDDADAHFDRWTTGVIDQGLRGADAEKRAAVSKVLGERFAALPATARQAMLASMLATILPDPALPRAPAAAQPVTLASQGITLTGTRRAFRSADDRLMVEDQLTGAGTGPAGSFDIALTEQRALDPDTGLIRSSVRVRRTTSGGAVQTITTRTLVDPPRLQ